MAAAVNNSAVQGRYTGLAFWLVGEFNNEWLNTANHTSVLPYCDPPPSHSTS